MSKMETILGNETAESRFQANFDRLEAVESVVTVISEMTDSGAHPTLGLPQKDLFQGFYLTGSPMLQRRVDSICDDLAVTARSGARALLQFQSEGRDNLSAAASCLMREIHETSAQILVLMRK